LILKIDFLGKRRTFVNYPPYFAGVPNIPLDSGTALGYNKQILFIQKETSDADSNQN
jgi:hypothetical protein